MVLNPLMNRKVEEFEEEIEPKKHPNDPRKLHEDVRFFLINIDEPRRKAAWLKEKHQHLLQKNDELSVKEAGSIFNRKERENQEMTRLSLELEYRDEEEKEKRKREEGKKKIMGILTEVNWSKEEIQEKYAYLHYDFFNTSRAMDKVIMGIILGIGILAALVDYFLLPEDSINRKMDSFFFVSGVLLAFIWFKEFKKDKRKVMSVQGWVLFYVHRIVRLTPPYYIAVIFYTYVFRSLTSNMPLYLIQGIDQFSPVLYCQKNWWTNFLFINNLCFGQGWYVATDMQMVRNKNGIERG
uniref:Uncharacterized protein n=1 Tax=Acrobeloides nanus TaxID=290746 RepID=A0A914DQ36_9BILA